MRGQSSDARVAARKQASSVIVADHLRPIAANVAAGSATSVERAIRSQTIATKSSLFAGSNGGGQTCATIATQLRTAMNNVDPPAWVALTVQRIANGSPNSEIDALCNGTTPCDGLRLPVRPVATINRTKVRVEVGRG
ncbi:hypothetical protein ABIB75_008090 [Bradyrhizobium sp. GM2.2]